MTGDQKERATEGQENDGRSTPSSDPQTRLPGTRPPAGYFVNEEYEQVKQLRQSVSLPHRPGRAAMGSRPAVTEGSGG